MSVKCADEQKKFTESQKCKLERPADWDALQLVQRVANELHLLNRLLWQAKLRHVPVYNVWWARRRAA